LDNMAEIREKVPDAPSVDDMVTAARESMPEMLKEYAMLSRHMYEILLGEMDDDTPGNIQPALFDNDDDDEPLTPAEELLIDAFEAESQDEAADYARQALALDPLSVQARLILAQTAHSLPERVKWLEQAVEAGEKFFGEEFFKDSLGHFWGLHETRPFMHALADLAMSYKLEGKLDKAISCYQRCLTLNPNDNQAVRYSLLSCYIQKNQLEKADQLMHEYDEPSAFMCYARALVCFIREGDSPAARVLKKQALASNKYIPKLLAGRSKMPKLMPDYYSPGDKNEAVIYIEDYQAAWRQVIGAMGWLLK
ncbi:MAG TPA: tetratricopeptide repeat protein, partial [Cellvibrionaceae bacterium]